MKQIVARGAALHLIPIETRIPLKFGNETLTHVVCSRVRLDCATTDGQHVTGWGETPLSVQWVWPSELPYAEREAALVAFSERLTAAWADFEPYGHPLTVGREFLSSVLPPLRDRFNTSERAGKEPLPVLAALVCCSPFDIALHDAFGIACNAPIYDLYGPEYGSPDLGGVFGDPAFRGKCVEDYLSSAGDSTIPAWHLVGGKDAVAETELSGDEPNDGYPVVLSDWINVDQLRCLKVKLTGDDQAWDLGRLERVGSVAFPLGVEWLTADFNCRVVDPAYVNQILDTIRDRDPRLYGALLYVEQPFPYDLEANPIDVHSVSARKPLFMDESAHDWTYVRRGYELGWTGVALKTCKTQTGALLSLAWAHQHGMQVMVQDLTNPMLAQISHAQLGYYAGTIMGVETNSMQFYPAASAPEEAIHPGLFGRTGGTIDLSSCLERPGFGYRIDEIERRLPAPVAEAGR